MFFFNLLILNKERGGERERGRNTDFMNSLVDRCLRLDQGWNRQPWHIENSPTNRATSQGPEQLFNEGHTALHGACNNRKLTCNEHVP